MTPVTYDFGSYKKGNTLIETPFRVQRSVSGVVSDIPITDCTITCVFKKKSTSPASLTLSTSNYLEITNGISGRFKVKPVVLNMDAGLYYYDMEFLFSNGEKKTYITGTIYIESNYTS